MTVVRDFHVVIDQPYNDIPVIPPADHVRRRIRLMKEEWKEVEVELIALLGAVRDGARLPKILEIERRLLKELADLRYVSEGTAVEFGLPIDAAFAAVHASNMTKRFRDGAFRKDPGGKVLKGEDYAPPDMAALVPDPTDAESYKDGNTVVTPHFTFSAGPGVTLG